MNKRLRCIRSFVVNVTVMYFCTQRNCANAFIGPQISKKIQLRSFPSSFAHIKPSGKLQVAQDDAKAMEIKSESAPKAFSDEGETYKSALTRTAAWVALSFMFGTALWILVSPTTGEEFFAGYLIEQSLSVDNLFVFLLLFDYFKVPLAYQDRVLNWGIYGAIVMRGLMIGIGAAALAQFHAILLVFASILVYSSAQVFLGGDDDEEEDPSQNSIVMFARSLFPSTDDFDSDRFFTLVDGVKTATPLFICMIAVEISDVVFAVDSIPAVFGVTEVCATMPITLSPLLTVLT